MWSEVLQTNLSNIKVQISVTFKELKRRLSEHFFEKQQLVRLMSVLNLYNHFSFQMGQGKGDYPYDFYYHINRGVVEILKSFYSLNKSNFIYRESDKPSAEIRELGYDVSYITAIFYFITLNYENSNYLINTENDKYLKIYNIKSLKKNLLDYINSYQSKLLNTAQDLTINEIDIIFKVLSINFDNYEIALNKGNIEHLFIQINSAYCTHITKYSPVEYLSVFVYLNKLLQAYFSDDYNANRDSRENIMFNKLQQCLTNETLQIKQGLKLRNNNKILTDIDATIYDSDLNTAYLVQFKYQDDFICDLKVKRNQVGRLKKQINSWFVAIENWLENQQISSFLKDSGFKNVKKIPKIKYIVFTQYNINQLLLDKIHKDSIYVSDAMFYQTYSKTKNFDKLYNEIYRKNRKPLEDDYDIYNESYHLYEYEIFFDNDSNFDMEVENRWHHSSTPDAIDLTEYY